MFPCILLMARLGGNVYFTADSRVYRMRAAAETYGALDDLAYRLLAAMAMASSSAPLQALCGPPADHSCPGEIRLKVCGHSFAAWSHARDLGAFVFGSISALLKNVRNERKCLPLRFLTF
jgi:hypothetical protein